MNKILAAALFALCAVCAQAKPFSPEQYAKVLREYNSVAGANNYFESGKFKEEFELRKKYCDEGLIDACGDWFGGGRWAAPAPCSFCRGWFLPRGWR